MPILNTKCNSDITKYDEIVTKLLQGMNYTIKMEKQRKIQIDYHNHKNINSASGYL